MLLLYLNILIAILSYSSAYYTRFINDGALSVTDRRYSIYE